MLDNQKEQLKSTIKDISILRADLGVKVKSIEYLNEIKLDKEKFESVHKSMTNHWNCANEEISFLKANISSTDNYLEKYLPVKTLNYIHDILLCILDRKELVKIFDYLLPIYTSLEQSIANDDGKSHLNK